MPLLNTPISGSTEKIMNPVAEQVARDVLKVVGASKLFSDNIYINNETSGGSNYKRSGSSKTMGNRCDINVKISRDPFNNPHNNTKDSDVDSKFHSRRRTISKAHTLIDPTSNIFLTEAKSLRVVTMEFTVRLKSINLMDTFINRMESVFVNNGSAYQNHYVRTSYTIPDKILLALKRLYDLKTHSNPNGASFPTFVSEYSEGKIGIVKNRDDQNDIAVNVTSQGIELVGRINGNIGSIEPEKEGEITTRHTVTFTYEFVLSCPVSMHLEFPVAVDGKYVPQEYMQKSEKDGLYAMNTFHSNTAFGTSAESGPKILLSLSYPWIRYPSADDWVGLNVNFPKFYDRFLPRFSGVVGVAEDGVAEVSVVNEIFPVLGGLDDVILDAFTMTDLEEHARMESLYQILLFANDHVVEPSDVTLTPDLDLRYEGGDPKRVHRIVIVQQRDVSVINRKYFTHIFTHHEFYRDFIYANLPYFVTHGYLKVLKVNGTDYLQIGDTQGDRLIGEAAKYHGQPIYVHNYTLLVTNKRR